MDRTRVEVSLANMRARWSVRQGQLMAARVYFGPPLPSWPPSKRDGEDGLALRRKRRRLWSGAMALSLAIGCLLLIVTPVGGAAAAAGTGVAEAGACTADSCPAPAAPANSTPPASDPPIVKEEPKKAVKPPDQPVRPLKVQNEVNYASITAGAVVLDHSEALIGSSSLLDDNKDKYARSPCDQAKWVVINLSEDIRVQTLVLANYEKFSSLVKDFKVFYSITMPKADQDWKLLGNFTGKEKQGEQRFIVEKPEYARYLKFSLMTHYGKEFFCTLSQIKVHGSTLQQGFMDDWEKQKKITGDQLTAIRPQQSAEAGIPEAGSTPVEGTGGNGSTAEESRPGEAVAAEVNPILDVPVPKANLSGGAAAVEGGGGEEANVRDKEEEEEQGREEKEGAGVGVAQPLPVGGGSSGPGATGSADEATPLPKDTKPAATQAPPLTPPVDGKPKAGGGESKPAQEGPGTAAPGVVGGGSSAATATVTGEGQPPAAPSSVPAVEVEKATPEASTAPLPVAEPAEVVVATQPPQVKDVGTGPLFPGAADEGSAAAPVVGDEAPKPEGKKPPVVASTVEPVAPNGEPKPPPRTAGPATLEPTVSATAPAAAVASEQTTVGASEASPQAQAPPASAVKPAVPAKPAAPSSAASEAAVTNGGKAVELEPAPAREENVGETEECELASEQAGGVQEPAVVDPSTAAGVGREPLVAAENVTVKRVVEAAEPIAVKVGSAGAAAEGVASEKEQPAAVPVGSGSEEAVGGTAASGPVGVVEQVEKAGDDKAKQDVVVEAGATVVVNTTNGPPMPPATIPAIPPVRILGRPLSHQHDGLARVRHRCLEQLGLAEFKRQKLAMLKDSGEDKPGGPVVGGGGSPYDNIFRTLMNEIASLEINQSIFDVYVSSLHNCVVQVVEEMRMDSERTTHELHEAIESLAYRVRVLSEVNESYLVKLNDLENRVFVSCAGGFLSLCSLGLLVLVLCWQFVSRRRQPAKY